MNILLCVLAIILLQVPLTASEHKTSDDTIKKSPQLYDSNIYLEKFLTLLEQNPQLRGQRVNTWISMIELCMYQKIPYKEALKQGIPINQQDTTSATCLMKVARGYWEKDMVDTPVTKELLALNADPTLQDDEGRNSLGYALSSDRGGRQALVLAGHPKIARIINEPTLIHGHRQTYLRAIIHSNYAYNSYRQDIAKTLLNAGAQATLEDVIDSAHCRSCCKPLFKRCSLTLLQQAWSTVSNRYPYEWQLLLSKENALHKGIAYQSSNGQLKRMFPKKVYGLIKGYWKEEGVVIQDSPNI